MEITRLITLSLHWRIIRLMLSITNRWRSHAPLKGFRQNPYLPFLDPPIPDLNMIFNGNSQLIELLGQDIPLLPKTQNDISSDYATAYELSFRYLYPLEDPPLELLDTIPTWNELIAFEDHLISETKDKLSDTNFRETEKHLKRQYDFSYIEIPNIIRLTLFCTDSNYSSQENRALEVLRLNGIESRAMSASSQDYSTALNAVRTRIKVLGMESDEEDYEKTITKIKEIGPNAKGEPKQIDYDT